MLKIDYKKEFKELYKPSAVKAAIINVPEMNFLMIDGQGDPANEISYQQAIEALYAVAYTVKFLIKKNPAGVDYSVMPLEGLWWAHDMSAFKEGRRNEWLWTMMILQPEMVHAMLVNQAIRQVREKKNPAALDKLRFAKFNEGKAAQIMHIGPFSEEGPTIDTLHTFIEKQGGRIRDKHHEIYLTDMRRATPEKWKTIIRQPMV